MAEKTNIGWCDATVNFWWGCTKISPACANCYAETLSNRFRKEIWGKGKPREDHRKGAMRLAMKLERKAIAEGRRLRVFCNSMSDWLDDEVPIEWLADLLELISATPHLDWLLLSKRPENWYRRVSLVSGEMAESWIDCIDMPERGVIPENVWIGTTLEDKPNLKRLKDVRNIPANVRFLSSEPLLEDLGEIGEWAEPQDGGRYYIDGIHWVICGGESGEHARPMRVDWARFLRDQCVATGVPFFFKQWGEWLPAGQVPSSVAADFPWLKDGATRVPFREGSYRIGTKHSGNLLDGRKWEQFPERGAR